MKKRLFEEITVWFEKSKNEVIRYRILKDLSNEKFFVKSAEHFPKKNELIDVKIYDSNFVDNLFDNGITYFAKDSFETIEEAISGFDSIS